MITRDDKGFTATMARQRARVPELASLRGMNARGDVVWGEGVLQPPVSYADVPDFIRARDDPSPRSILGRPVISRTHGGAVLPFGRRAVRPDGRFAGVAYGAVRLDRLSALMASLDQGAGHVIELRTDDMTLVARHPGGTPVPSASPAGASSKSAAAAAASHPAESSQQAGAAASPESALAAALASGADQARFQVARSAAAPDGLLGAWRRNARSGIVVSVVYDRRLALESIHQTQASIVALAASMVLLALAFGAFVQRARARERRDVARQRAEAARWRSILDAMVEGLLVRAPDGRVLDANPAAATLLGTTVEALRERGGFGVHSTMLREDLTTLPPHEHPGLVALRTGRPVRDQLFGRREDDGSLRWFSLNAQPIRDDADGAPSAVLTTFVDVTERRRQQAELQRAREAAEQASRALQQANEQLARLAVTDGLTGLFNRRHFEERLAVELARLQRHPQPLSLVMFDVDHFKSVNDRFGHAQGDRVLVALARAAQQQVRASDVLARWGGEEFIVLLPGDSAAEAMRLAERLRDSFESLVVPGVGTVTASFGVAELADGESADDLCLRADEALYAAKDAGRNRCRLARPPEGTGAGLSHEAAQATARGDTSRRTDAAPTGQ